MGIVEKCVDILKQAATRAAQVLPADAEVEELWRSCACAHNELAQTRGYSPWQMLLGRSPPGLGLPGEARRGPAAAPEPPQSRIAIREACFREYITSELKVQEQRAARHQDRKY